jgi:hypothetical protein
MFILGVLDSITQQILVFVQSLSPNSQHDTFTQMLPDTRPCHASAPESIGSAPPPLAINPTTMISGNAQLRLSNSTHYNYARDVNALVRRPPHGIPAQRQTDLKPQPTSEECTDKFTGADRANTGRITQGIEYLRGLN